jgi:hypothetical protein
MGFRLANVEGRAALVHGDHYCDLSTVSDGSLPSDPMGALGQAAELSTLASTLGEQEPTGFVADVVPGPPVPAPAEVVRDRAQLSRPRRRGRDGGAQEPARYRVRCRGWQPIRAGTTEKRRVEPRHVDCS